MENELIVGGEVLEIGCGDTLSTSDNELLL